jgi:murein DD-endopeptidase MepM/ murein hydrolase activator NlpD
MHKIILTSGIFFLLSCKGQNNKVSPDLLIKKFAGYYNGQQYDSVFFLFSSTMRKSLPLEKTSGFLSRLQSDAGAIENYEYVSTQDGFARYKAHFTNSVLWLDISQNRDGNIDGISFIPYDGPGEKNVMPRNLTKMSLPFTGEWFVFWGGDTKEQNYHVENVAQKNAFDIIITDTKGKSYKTDGTRNEDYYAFGQPLIAPCDAEVLIVVDGIADNVPGEMNREQVTGNTVVLKTANNEYLLFAHFKQNSIKVKKGEAVKKGQLLGLCGNSGNSSEPHLHFHIQNKEKMNLSTGIKCYFEKLLVNGIEKSDYSPVKGDRIKNAG